MLLASVLLLGALRRLFRRSTAIYLSLTNEALSGPAATHPRFVGVRNYVRLFTDDGFWNSLVVTSFSSLGSAVDRPVRPRPRLRRRAQPAASASGVFSSR